MADLRESGLQTGQKVAVYDKEYMTGVVVFVDYPNDELTLSDVRGDGVSGKCDLRLRISDCTFIRKDDSEMKEQQPGAVDKSESAPVCERDDDNTDKAAGATADIEPDWDNGVGPADNDSAGQEASATQPSTRGLRPICESPSELIEVPVVKLIYVRNSSYKAALADLRKHWVVSLLCADIVLDNIPASVILLATSKHVYPFVLNTLTKEKKPPHELKEFLEGLPTPYKVVHNTQQCTAHLERLGIKLSAVADNFKMYCKLTGNQQPMTLAEMLHKCFDLTGIGGSSHPLQPLCSQVTLQLKIFEHMVMQQMSVAFKRPEKEFTLYPSDEE